jgi:hypothetical protein
MSFAVAATVAVVARSLPAQDPYTDREVEQKTQQREERDEGNELHSGPG